MKNETTVAAKIIASALSVMAPDKLLAQENFRARDSSSTTAQVEREAALRANAEPPTKASVQVPVDVISVGLNGGRACQVELYPQLNLSNPQDKAIVEAIFRQNGAAKFDPADISIYSARRADNLKIVYVDPFQTNKPLSNHSPQPVPSQSMLDIAERSNLKILGERCIDKKRETHALVVQDLNDGSIHYAIFKSHGVVGGGDTGQVAQAAAPVALNNLVCALRGVPRAHEIHVFVPDRVTRFMLNLEVHSSHMGVGISVGHR